MAKTSSLLDKLRRDFPAFQFKDSDDFYWSPSTHTIFTKDAQSDSDKLTLLHEVAHGVLGHKAYKRDIDLVKIEREAWEYVRSTLAPRYGLKMNDDTVEDAIDTYREWLHERSTCPQCSQTGIQTGEAIYHCLSCNQDWRVNDARHCGLKRYSLTN